MRISDWSSDVCSSDLFNTARTEDFCGLGVHFIGNKNFGHVLLLCPSSPRSGVHVHSVAKCRKWLPAFGGMTMYSVKTYARAVAQAQSNPGPRDRESVEKGKRWYERVKYGGSGI